jgi:hypothetical protein
MRWSVPIPLLSFGVLDVELVEVGGDRQPHHIRTLTLQLLGRNVESPTQRSR